MWNSLQMVACVNIFSLFYWGWGTIFAYVLYERFSGQENDLLSFFFFFSQIYILCTKVDFNHYSSGWLLFGVNEFMIFFFHSQDFIFTCSKNPINMICTINTFFHRLLLNSWNEHVIKMLTYGNKILKLFMSSKFSKKR